MLVVVLLLAHLGIAVSCVLLIARIVKVRRRGVAGHVGDTAEAAFLAGGPGQVVDAAIAGMCADGRLTVGGPGIVAVGHGVAHDPVEESVLQELAAAPSGALHKLRFAVMRGPAVQGVGDALAARGLLVAPVDARAARKWAAVQTAVCFLALPVVIVLAGVLFMKDRDSGTGSLAVSVLLSLFAGGIVGLVCTPYTRTWITGAGRGALRDFRARNPRVPGAAPLPAARLVAAYGLAALPDPVLAQRLRTAARRRPGRTVVATAQGTAAAMVMWCSGALPGVDTGGGYGSDGGGSCGGNGGGGSCGGGSGNGSACGGGSSGGSSCGGSSSGGGGGCGGGGGGGGGG
ncbi:TIGR04222 domain-containing membrane protein [Streptomyces sp. NPDC095613]|uniref:TIGR04222 domain-containing membrane protein n=1 Tax=Streptomyces sp. NPDC095613 TaxID=3155540 RepID=UPI003327B45F